MRKDQGNTNTFELARTSIGLEISLHTNAKIENRQNKVLYSDDFFHLDSNTLSTIAAALHSKNSGTGSKFGSKNIFVPEANPQTITLSKSKERGACFNTGELWRPHLLRFLPNYPFKDHQKIGVSWLHGRKSGILADDMGLGKTLQAIAALDQHIRDMKVKCSLVVCPKSLIGVWEAEIKLWAPHLCIVTVCSTIAESKWNMVGQQCHVAITNYETIRSNNPNPNTFDLVIYDEIHKLKNFRSSSYNSAYKLRPEITWGLSGTPLENKPTELVSILHLIDRNRVAISESKFGPASLRSLASRYILRRNKTVISGELPSILEKIEHVPLSREQRDAYNKIRKKGNTKQLSQWIKLFGQLRELCDFDPNTHRSTKIDRAVELVKAIRQLDEKVVIFSYLVAPLSLLHSKLISELGSAHSLAILTGSSSASDRTDTINLFQEKQEPSVLLCTTRAMAEGVTLTSANHVIFLNEWWNPAINSQARDRVYRIGQKKDVYVYRIRTIDTVETRLEEILNSKSELFSEIVSKLSSDILDHNSETPKEYVRLLA
ncbi:MAG: DEAD/DEAH box helicase [Gammaproteobacteria bacterium]|nr:DEAD/DEAH box helicase [Gammaproteobacteria bacterium]MYG96721.1 DEAD/DEAH box helicase [Gammaproteobacteria bacterium]